MKIQKQRKLSSVDGTVRGSCMRTCHAAIMDKDQDELPFWEDMGTEWHESYFDTLIANGLEYWGTCDLSRVQRDFPNNPEAAHEEFMRKLKEYEGVDGYVLVSGDSWREHVVHGHMVVYNNGELFLDPHPENNGLKRVTKFWYVERKK